MDVSRLFFSRETQEKMKQELTPTQKSKLRWSKLKEAEDRGTLNRAKNRYEVANLVGFPEAERNRGYQWVANLIRRKHLVETIIGVGKNGKMEFEYHTSSAPDFDHKNLVEARKRTAMANMAAKKAAKEREMERNRGLSHKERGRNRYEELLKAEEDGRLRLATNRVEVARLAGMDDETYKTAYSWVSNLISRGHIIETPIKKINGKKVICTYKIGIKPDYNLYKKENPKIGDIKPSNTHVKEVTDAMETTDTNEQEVVTTITASSNVVKITIRRGDFSMEIDNMDYENLSQFIVDVFNKMKGENNE